MRKEFDWFPLLYVTHFGQSLATTFIFPLFSSLVVTKDTVSEMNNKVASECVQLHGGWGYMWEYPIARAFTDSRVFPIYAGSNEIMKELIARDIIKD